MSKRGRLIPMSRIAPKEKEREEIDTVASAKKYGDRRAFDILMEAQYYWNQMEDFLSITKVNDAMCSAEH